MLKWTNKQYCSRHHIAGKRFWKAGEAEVAQGQEDGRQDDEEGNELERAQAKVGEQGRERVGEDDDERDGERKELDAEEKRDEVADTRAKGWDPNSVSAVLQERLNSAPLQPMSL